MSKVFNSKSKDKLDHPKRRKALPPRETLLQLGLQVSDIVADIGCGTGYFTIPALDIVGGDVYAIDISDEMLDSVKSKVSSERLKLVKSDFNHLMIADESSSFALLSMVLHEVDDPRKFLQEVNRVLKKDGRLAIIEWKKIEMKMGPRYSHRMDIADIEKYTGGSFVLVKEIDLSENFYGCVWKKRAK
ncbi:hypothetical protein SANA_13800 [Gottschalkiaceae bacterium SANA]|nr:hypothetical protein SANA_13800 [Gottschalkiaceae bacterium SANA]